MVHILQKACAFIIKSLVCVYANVCGPSSLSNEEQAGAISPEHCKSSRWCSHDGCECNVYATVCVCLPRESECRRVHPLSHRRWATRILTMICRREASRLLLARRATLPSPPPQKNTKAPPFCVSRVCALHVNKQTNDRAKNIEPNNALTFMARRLSIIYLGWMDDWLTGGAGMLGCLRTMHYLSQPAAICAPANETHARSFAWADEAARVDMEICLLEKQAFFSPDGGLLPCLRLFWLLGRLQKMWNAGIKRAFMTQIHYENQGQL